MRQCENSELVASLLWNVDKSGKICHKSIFDAEKFSIQNKDCKEFKLFAIGENFHLFIKTAKIYRC